MSLKQPFEPNIVVVDPRPRDYAELASLAEQHVWHLHFLTTGRAAVTFARRARADVWMVNTRLPDMSGLALFEGVREQIAGATTTLVSDRYDASLERLACQLGAALYLGKGPHGAFDCRLLLQILASAAARARGPANATMPSRAGPEGDP